MNTIKQTRKTLIAVFLGMIICSVSVDAKTVTPAGDWLYSTSAFLLPSDLQDKTGACFFDASGKLKGRDSCLIGDKLTPCGVDTTETCTIDAKGICKEASDYALYLVLKKEDNYDCPATFPSGESFIAFAGQF